MSNTDNTTRDWRHETSTERRGTLGMVRQMAIRLTEGSFWQLIGHTLLDNLTKETVNAEAFGALGFYSRPRAGANAAAIVVYPGGSSNPVIVATSDEELRATVAAANLGQDGAIMCNRATIVLCRADGTVEIRAPGGVAQKSIRGETYRSSEDTMLTAVSSAIALISNIPGLTAPQIAIVTAATVAITTFKSAAATYLTTVLRAQ